MGTYRTSALNAIQCDSTFELCSWTYSLCMHLENPLDFHITPFSSSIFFALFFLFFFSHCTRYANVYIKSTLNPWTIFNFLGVDQEHRSKNGVHKAFACDPITDINYVFKVIFSKWISVYSLPICFWSACISGDNRSFDCHVCLGHGVKSFKCCCVHRLLDAFSCLTVCGVFSAVGIPAYGSIEYDVDEGVAIPPNGCAK